MLTLLAAGLFPRDTIAQLATQLPVAREGVAPPARIEGLEARPVVPLEFSRAWLDRVAEVRRRRGELQSTGELDGLEPAAAAARGAALAGELRVPVIAVAYADVTPPFGTSVLESRLFGAGQGDTVSFAGYWREVSGGLLDVVGSVSPWIRLPRPAKHYLAAEEYGWGRFGRVSELREQALRAGDRVMDYGLYDNDGPDGVPNSGDDDGFVDFVALLYATSCEDERAGGIWPHRGAMPPYETEDAAAGGGRIRISDYVILSATERGTCAPLQIGVLAHESGHALGLPDLYDYDGSSQGIGSWGLMGTGSHAASHSPAHLGAWAKEQLGWVRVDWIDEATTELDLAAVVSSRRVARYDLPGGTGEYLLLENRQRLGSDSNLPGSGLLVWRVDPDQGEMGAWNGDEWRPAVALVEADGRGDLARGRRADDGDPFPGTSRNTVLVLPEAQPFRLTGIEERGDRIFALASTTFTGPALVATPRTVRLATPVRGSAVSQTVRVSREAGATGPWIARSDAAWLAAERVGDVLVVRADPAGLAPGRHAASVRVEPAGAGVDGTQVAVELRIAAPGEVAVVADGLPWSWGLAAEDGRILQASYGWDALSLRPRPRLIELHAGEGEPSTVMRLPADALFSPVPAGRGASYVLARAREQNYLYRVGGRGDATLVAGPLGDAPAYGTALLRDGSLLVSDWSGRIQHVLPDGRIEPWTHLNTHIYQIAVDTAGTLYAAAYEGDVLRLDASGALRRIPTGFGRGRLVAITAAPDGTVFAAERGGLGRILRILPDGTVRPLTEVAGGNFYGVALDGTFLYALDLGHRQLLRIDTGAAALAALGGVGN